MANEFVTFNPYDEQIEKLRQRQKMADLLQQQALQPLESQVAPGGYAVRTSPVLGLAKMLQAYMGGREQSNIDKELAGIREETTDAMRGITGRMFGERPTAPSQMPVTKPSASTFDELGYEETAPKSPRPIQIGKNATFAPRSIEEAGKRTIESNQLGEITPTAQYQYQYDPSGAMQMAMTPAGARAMQGNPLLASLLAQMVKPKEAEKFGTTPVRGADGKYYLVSESGRMVPTNVAGFDKEATPTDLSKLIAERNALPADSPLRAIYDAAISKSTTQSPGVTVYSGSPVAGVDEQGNPVFFQTNKAGGAPSIIPGVRPKPEAMGAAESNAATFADRMTNAERTLSTLPPVPISQRVAGAIPLVGNTLINARNRQFNQAEQDFISAVLRKESGAAISDAEYEREAKKYIPMAGDDPETLKMKSQARKAALEGMRRSAGPSYKPAPVSFGAPVSGGSSADIFSQADAILGR